MSPNMRVLNNAPGIIFDAPIRLPSFGTTGFRVHEHGGPAVDVIEKPPGTTVPACNHPNVIPGQARGHVVTEMLPYVIQRGQWSACDQPV